MRQYIQKHLTPQIDKRREAIRTFVQGIYDNEPLKVSSVAGSANNRANLRNCFIFGSVEVEGNGKMVDCIVMPGVTVQIGDGAIIAHCLFMPQPGADNTTIKIGKNSAVYKSIFRANVEVGADSVIFTASLGYVLQREMTGVYLNIRLGDRAFIYFAGIYYEPYDSGTTTEYNSGSDHVIIATAVRLRGSFLQAGNSFILARYVPTLKRCVEGFTEPLSTDTTMPIQNQETYCRENLKDLREATFPAPATIGDNCYMGTMIQFTERNKRLPNKCICIGNDVNLIPGCVEPAGRRWDSTLCVDRLSLGNGSTLAVGYVTENNRTFHELRVDDQAVLLLQETDAKTTVLGHNLHITKQHAVII